MGFLVQSEFAIDGLHANVEIIVDEWGVPHIYALNRADLFFAQGFNAARDRLYQIDLWRRRGLGLLAEVFGQEYLEQDRAARLFLYRGDSRAEWLAYGSATKAIVTSFTRGINAYVNWVGQDPDRLPPEFAALGYEPLLWNPEDVTRIRSHGLAHNAEQELARALTLRDFGPQVEAYRQTREPADPLVIPDGLDLDMLSEDVLRTYLLGRAPVLPPEAAAGFAGAHESSGSNNWVISGERTSTGRPILANDPHRAVSLPSLRYIAHLSAPGIDVIGGGEPSLPGISIGHNGHVAFGLTIWPADQEDLYVYETKPENPRQYLYKGEWEEMEVVSENIPVADGSGQATELRFTRHGPVIYEDPDRAIAVALRAVWLEPGMAPYLCSLEYLKAQDAEAFVDALNRWGAPAVSQVYATPDGVIGVKSAALIPVRPNWDGSLPVPGDGRYEWQGFYDADQTPAGQDPTAGWIATANQMNLNEDYPNTERTVTYDWYPSGRYERIAEVLSEGGDFTVEHSAALQNDAKNAVALEICGYLRHINSVAADNAQALELLQNWLGDEDSDSSAALVFQIWMRRHFRSLLLKHGLRTSGMEEEAAEASMAVLLRDESFNPDLRAELSVLRSLDLANAADRAALASMVDESLTGALREIHQLQGTDSENWAWGNLHHSEIQHGMLAAVSGAPDSWKTVGPGPKRGSGDTVGLAAYDATFNMTLGSTFRIVIDVGGWDNSLAMNSPGQSGDPRSTRYADLFQPWLNAESFPLCYSRQAVELHASERIVLRPARGESETGGPGQTSGPGLAFT